MYYSIRHQTRFRYSSPVSESIMEMRLQPRTEWTQHCLSFEIELEPRTRVFHYRDYLGNTVHHFNVPGQHQQLDIVSTSLVEVNPFADWPSKLDATAWDEVDAQVNNGDYYEMLMPSDFAQPTPALMELAVNLQVARRDDPMTMLRQLNTAIHGHFDYTPKSTRVDSPIDDALRTRKGVCQDFAHVMISLVRLLKIPCRYVSGYVAPGEMGRDRRVAGSASHAWVEAWLPGWGWVGFDPTNNRLVSERHIRIAVGRDYADVPPTKGLYKGESKGELAVQVIVLSTDKPANPEVELVFPSQDDEWTEVPADERPGNESSHSSHQQQQQQ
jgi:transglutaminase-like putative cysteine protease